MAILKIKDKDGNFISVPTITGMPKGIYMGVNEPTDLETILWIDTSEPAPTLITFTVQSFGETYTAEEGMTWGEWIASEYNPHLGDNSYFQDSGIIYKAFGLMQLEGSGVAVQSEHIIVADGVYVGMSF